MCRPFYCVGIEPHCKHGSIEFSTTQTDQSKRDILIDYVLIFFNLCAMLSPTKVQMYNIYVVKVKWNSECLKVIFTVSLF